MRWEGQGGRERDRQLVKRGRMGLPSEGFVLRGSQQAVGANSKGCTACLGVLMSHLKSARSEVSKKVSWVALGVSMVLILDFTSAE